MGSAHVTIISAEAVTQARAISTFYVFTTLLSRLANVNQVINV